MCFSKSVTKTIHVHIGILIDFCIKVIKYFLSRFFMKRIISTDINITTLVIVIKDLEKRIKKKGGDFLLYLITDCKHRTL